MRIFEEPMCLCLNYHLLLDTHLPRMIGTQSQPLWTVSAPPSPPPTHPTSWPCRSTAPGPPWTPWRCSGCTLSSLPATTQSVRIPSSALSGRMWWWWWWWWCVCVCVHACVCVCVRVHVDVWVIGGGGGGNIKKHCELAPYVLSHSPCYHESKNIKISGNPWEVPTLGWPFSCQKEPKTQRKWPQI